MGHQHQTFCSYLNIVQQTDTTYYILQDSTLSASCSNIPVCYKIGYFQDEPLLHTEVPFRYSNWEAEPHNNQLWLNSIVSLVTFCTILFATLLYLRIHKRYLKMTKVFFYPTANLSAAEAEESIVSAQETTLVSAILSILGGIAAYSFWEVRHTFFLPTSPLLFIAIYTALSGVFFLTRKLLYVFVNWVFFTPEQITLWRRAYSYILVTETIFYTATVALIVYYGTSEEVSIFLATTVFVLTRLLLFYKGYRIFFGKIYGFLHLFVYLCTLEAMTLLIMLNFLAFLTDTFIVKI